MKQLSLGLRPGMEQRSSLDQGLDIRTNIRRGLQTTNTTTNIFMQTTKRYIL
jgi:hypothetical protein